MSRQRIPKAYTDFKNFLKVRSYLVRCSWLGCDEKVLPKRYQEHCKTRHDLDVLVRCAFCRGKASWERKQKTQMGEHLHACAERFVRIYGTNELEPQSESVDSSNPNDESTMPTATLRLSNETAFPEDDDGLRCSERCHEFRSWTNRTSFRSKWNDRDWIEGGAGLMEEPLFESNPERLNPFESNPERWIPEVKRRMRNDKIDKERWLALLNPLRFDPRSGLGQAHIWIRRFLYTHWTNTWTWYHLSVRAGCMASFKKAMEGIDIVAAPNWCVCDGGFGFNNSPLQARQHHRHLIVAVKYRTQFQKAMEKKMEYRGSGETPKPGFKKYYGKLIRDATHFVNSLAYVSLPSSKCRCKQILGESDEENEWPFWNVEDRRGRRHQGHYLLHNNMHWHVRWWMHLLLPCKGLDTYAQFSIGSRSVYGMKSRGKVEGKWMLSAAEEFRVKNCVVRFEPTNLQIDGRHSIENLEDYIESPFEITFDGPPYPKSGNPFVYWFDGKKYPVRWMTERPPAFDDDESFQEWHATRGINTLLNLGESNSLFRMSRNMARHANDLDRQKRDYEKEMNEKLGAIERKFDEKEQALQIRFDEINLALRDELEETQKENKTYKEQLKKERYQSRQLQKEKEQLGKEKETEKKKYEDCKKEYDDFVKERFQAIKRDLEICRDEKKRLEEKKNCSDCNSWRLDKKKFQQKVKTLQQKIRRQK